MAELKIFLKGAEKRKGFVEYLPPHLDAKEMIWEKVIKVFFLQIIVYRTNVHDKIFEINYMYLLI